MKNIEDQFVPYELALKLKELGFNESCIKFWKQNDAKKVIQETWIEHPEWESSDILPDFRLVDLQSSNKKYLDIKDGECSAPLWQQAFAWFKEFLNCSSTIHIDLSYEIIGGVHTKGYKNEYHIESEHFHTYEEARLACLEKLIELIEKKISN